MLKKILKVIAAVGGGAGVAVGLPENIPDITPEQLEFIKAIIGAIGGWILLQTKRTKDTK